MDVPDGFERAAALLPPGVRERVLALPSALRHRAEELRLRMGHTITVRLPEREYAVEGADVTPGLIAAVLEAATRASLHAVGEELRRGFVTAPGGIRIGVCGTAVTERGIRGVREISSLCVRIPRQIPGAGREAIAGVGEDSVLILSPPGGGKTTLLRELIRTVSDRGTRVAVADERGEIAGCWGGQPQFDVGRCTDVLTGAPKAEAALLLLRSMAPEAVAMDEISAPEDLQAIEVLLGCGVRIYATAHGATAEEFCRRSACRSLLERGAFGKLIRISGIPRRYGVEAAW